MPHRLYTVRTIGCHHRCRCRRCCLEIILCPSNVTGICSCTIGRIGCGFSNAIHLQLDCRRCILLWKAFFNIRRFVTTSANTHRIHARINATNTHRIDAKSGNSRSTTNTPASATHLSNATVEPTVGQSVSSVQQTISATSKLASIAGRSTVATSIVSTLFLTILTVWPIGHIARHASIVDARTIQVTKIIKRWKQ